MKVVLLSDVRKIGRKYDVVDVKDGHALNFLIPQKKAVTADEKRIKWAEGKKKTDITEKEIQIDLLAKNIDSLQNTTITIKGKVNEQGHLFAGLHKEDIADALMAQSNISIDPEFIDLKKHIKEVGEHKINVLAGKVKGTFNLVVEAE